MLILHIEGTVEQILTKLADLLEQYGNATLGELTGEG